MAKKKKMKKHAGAGELPSSGDDPVLFGDNDAGDGKLVEDGPSVLVYLNPEQVEIVERVRNLLGLRVLAAGAPSTGGTAAVADGLGADRLSDLRRGVVEVHPDLIWMLTLDDIGNDARLLLLQEGTAPVLTMEPTAASISDAAADGSGDGVVFSPLMRRSPVLTVFHDLRESFGQVRSVNIAMRGHQRHGSLYGRLTDAIDMMEYLCGPAEQVDSAMSGPLGDPPGALNAMQGHLTVNARFAENCCACLHVSNMGAVWARGVTILGENGCIRLTDRVFEWWDHDGRLVDSATFSSVMGNSSLSLSDDGASLPELLIANDIRRMLDPKSPATGPIDHARTIAVCEAIRLSLHTGQGETPRKIQALIEAAR